MIKKIVLDRDKTQCDHRGRILIMASGGLNAVFSVALLMVAARTLPLEDTGILTIALAIAKLMLNIGKYGMRNYQVTEVQDVTFSEWLGSRLITVGAMVLCAMVYVAYQMIWHGYTYYKATIVFFLCMIYAGECVEDVYTGYYQKKGRLDVSSYIQIVRYVVLYVVFFVGLVVTHDLLLTTEVATILSIMVIWLCAIRTLKYFDAQARCPRKQVVKKLLKDCFPLFLMSFVLIYISNAPKYEIDNLYDADVQAYFGFVSMPIFAISLLSGFIFQPKLVNLSQSWKEGRIADFRHTVRRQVLYITAVSVFCLALGWIAGIPVLSFLYHAQGLEQYKAIFIVLLLGGAGTAVINFLTAVLVIFREQKIVLYVHLAVGGLIFLSIKPVIHAMGILGAVWDTTILTWILAAALVIAYSKTVLGSETSDKL